MSTVTIEIWSDIACPWCYIGKRRFAAALEQFPRKDQVRVVWRSFELNPDAEPSAAHPGMSEAQLLAERKGVPADQVRQIFAQITQVAAGEGLAYDFDRVIPANTFDAHRLVHLADERAGEVVERLMSAHFEHGKAVDEVDELVAIGADAGLDADAIRTALKSGQSGDAVRSDEAQAQELGVTGVPFFVADRRLAVSGAQPVEVFTQLLTQAIPAPAFVTVSGATSSDACGPDGC